MFIVATAVKMYFFVSLFTWNSLPRRGLYSNLPAYESSSLDFIEFPSSVTRLTWSVGNMVLCVQSLADLPVMWKNVGIKHVLCKKCMNGKWKIYGLGDSRERGNRKVERKIPGRLITLPSRDQYCYLRMCYARVPAHRKVFHSGTKIKTVSLKWF